MRVIVRDRVAALVGVAQEPAPEPAKEPAPEVVKVAVAQIAPAAVPEAATRAAMETATEAAMGSQWNKTLRQEANSAGEIVGTDSCWMQEAFSMNSLGKSRSEKRFCVNE